MKRLIGVLLVVLLSVCSQAEVFWVEHVVTNQLSFAGSTAAADLDGDGDMDFAGTSSLLAELSWWECIAPYTYSYHMITDSVVGATSVMLEDIDGDSDLDIVAAAAIDNELWWWENENGNGTVWTQHLVDDGLFECTSTFIIDIDGDNDNDILVAATQVFWYENTDGTGSAWTPHLVDAVFDGARSVHAADMNADGHCDLFAVSEAYDDIAWWENNGSQSFTYHNIGTLNHAYDIHVSDLDNDTDLDVIVAGFNSNTVEWWENTDGSGLTWTEHLLDANYYWAISVNAADIDDDGDNDILSAGVSELAVTWWENSNGDGTLWTEKTVSDSCYGAGSVHPADIDEDGDIDLYAVASTDNSILWWEQVPDLEPPEPVVINLTPHADPTVVPRGGIFFYDLDITFNLATWMTGYVWTKAILPNGAPYGPIFSVQFIFWPDLVISADNIGQSIPAMAPLGTYQWVVYAGLSLNNPVASDSFPFTVTPSGVEALGQAWKPIGHERISDSVFIESGTQLLPRTFAMINAYPNPFNPTTTISVSLPQAADLTVTVVNTLGQQVAELTNGRSAAGTHAFIFDASSLASGIYFVHATVPGELNAVQKVVLMK